MLHLMTLTIVFSLALCPLDYGRGWAIPAEDTEGEDSTCDGPVEQDYWRGF